MWNEMHCAQDSSGMPKIGGGAASGGVAILATICPWPTGQFCVPPTGWTSSMSHRSLANWPTSNGRSRTTARLVMGTGKRKLRHDSTCGGQNGDGRKETWFNFTKPRREKLDQVSLVADSWRFTRHDLADHAGVATSAGSQLADQRFGCVGAGDDDQPDAHVEGPQHVVRRD